MSTPSACTILPVGIVCCAVPGPPRPPSHRGQRAPRSVQVLTRVCAPCLLRTCPQAAMSASHLSHTSTPCRRRARRSEARMGLSLPPGAKRRGGCSGPRHVRCPLAAELGAAWACTGDNCMHALRTVQCGPSLRAGAGALRRRGRLVQRSCRVSVAQRHHHPLTQFGASLQPTHRRP